MGGIDDEMASKNGAARLAKLRELMRGVPVGSGDRGLDAYIIGSQDAHQSEYLAERDKARQFISSFTGSAGTAVITQDRAMLWTDGRYFSQAVSEMQPPEAWTLMKEGILGTPTQAAWLVSNLPPKSTVGADPNLMSQSTWTPIQTTLAEAGHSLLPVERNLVDLVWGDEKPALPANPIVPQPIKYSGKAAGEKIEHCRKAMREDGATALVFTALDEIAYLLNLRGSDIPYNPVFFAYVILTLDEVHIFVDEKKVTLEAKKQLKDEGVEPIYHPYDDVQSFLKEVSSETGKKTWISDNSSYALHANCTVNPANKKLANITPICVMKAIKNAVEIEGMKSAHLKDAVALVKYFSWLEAKVTSPDSEPITEISGATQLEKFRSEQDEFVGLSFDTISSIGPHGAIIHYSPTPETDAVITDKEMYLCDSGGQYRDGTTDVTRTFHFGKPTPFEIECFTRVFKGQCALTCAVFPSMIKGNYLDLLARKNLWDVGLDYLHGTSHGIGAYLNVHEGPMGISWRPHPHDPGLQPGMFLSNEPGYYEDGKFGIRIEDIEVIVEAKTPHNHNSRGFLTFQCVTLVPIQTSLLDISLLSDFEIKYLNRYHAECLEKVGPLLQGKENAQALEWLKRQTRPISR